MTAARSELRFSSRDSAVSRNLSSELMSDLSFRLNQQKTKHSEELHKSARSVSVLEEEVSRIRSKWNSEVNALRDQVVQLVN